MDNNLLESISKALKKLQHDQTVLSNKLIKVTEVCRNKFAKVEREQNEKHAFYDNKLDEHLKLNEDLKNRLDKIEKKNAHDSVENEMRISDIAKDLKIKSECIQILQDEHSKLDMLIKETDSMINDMDMKIHDSITTIEKLKNDDDNIQNEPKQNDDRKHCRYNRRGYCRQQENCPYYHTDEVCETYVATGVCCRQNCRLQHPKLCRYGNQCYRGKCCQYLHYNQTCQRCENFSSKLYHCEFCNESFCENCTVEQAHSKNIYQETVSGLPSCENIHQ